MHAPRCLVGKPRGPPTRVLQRPTLTGLHAGRGACAGTCAGRGRRRPRRTPPAWNPFPTPQPITLPQPCRPSACPAAHRRPPRGRLAGPRRRIWRRGRSTSDRSSRPCPWPREVVEDGVGSAARLRRKVSPGVPPARRRRSAAAFDLRHADTKCQRRRAHGSGEGREGRSVTFFAAELITGCCRTPRRPGDVRLDGQADATPPPWRAFGRRLEVPQRHPRTLH